MEQEWIDVAATYLDVTQESPGDDLKNPDARLHLRPESLIIDIVLKLPPCDSNVQPRLGTTDNNSQTSLLKIITQAAC